MLRWVLAKLGMQPSVVIYVRRCSQVGVPSNPDLFLPPSGLDMAILEVDSLASGTGISDSTPLLPRDILRYHKVERPHEHADIMYDNVIS